MLGSLPPLPAADRPELPRVRLEVRAVGQRGGSAASAPPGRTVSYEVGGDEFLLGGTSGCDLRLPAPNLPPVIAQISRKVDGVRVRRLTPALPVLLNANALPTNSPVMLSPGDILTLAGVEILVQIQHLQSELVSPKFIPVEEAHAPFASPQPQTERAFATNRVAEEHFRNPDDVRVRLDAEETARKEEWHRRDLELIRRARSLDEQIEELEADRVLWYRRRQEMELEYERHKAVLGDASKRGEVLDVRQQELERERTELEVARQRHQKEYQERRAELIAQQDEIRETHARFQAENQALQADLDRRRAELQAEVERHSSHLADEANTRRALLEEELRQKQAAFDADLADRTSSAEAEAVSRLRDQFAELERLQASARETLARAESEATAIRAAAQVDAAREREKLQAELAQYEPNLRELRERQDRLAAAFQELARQRDLFSADRDIHERARDTFEAARAAHAERIAAREKELSDREDEHARRLEQFHEDRAALEQDRTQFQDDLVRLERRTAAVEVQERFVAERGQEVDVRLEQLRRDSAEWEQTVQLAAAEQERLRGDAERLDRQRAELDSQSAILAERAGQLEAQQAVLAVLRSKLDRTRQESEREAAQLATARMREDESLAQLRLRIQEAEELRAELAAVQADTAQERDRLEERDSLLSTSLEEIRQQKDALTAEATRLETREAELDARSAEFAEQAGTLKGRMTQAFDLQARLEADRVAVREREAALTSAEEAGRSLQEQLRRRAEDLASRAKSLDEVARQVAADRAAFELARAQSEAERLTGLDEVNELRRRAEERAGELERFAADYADKEQSLGRQVVRLKDMGAAVAAERKLLAELRTKWEADRAAAAVTDAQAHDALAAFRDQAVAEIEELRRQAPELESHATAALERLTAARDMLRGHLSELHDFARLSREDLDAIRGHIRQEADKLREQEDLLNRAKAEHRLAVTAFRQQLIDWQGQVAEMKRTLANSESHLDARQAEVEAATKQVDATTIQLAEQAEQLRRERDVVSARRTEVERHLVDMREWYRKKLRELAGSGADAARALAADEPTVLKLHDTHSLPNNFAVVTDELEPGDRQLGELLRSHALVDAETLSALWAEAGRQRKTLRQVLLASGVVTLYQLALIEAGNLDALMIGRFRVIDRLRVTPREAVYRVYDPLRASSRTPDTHDGIYLLRHLSESEMHDAVRPDEFRQRFAAARDAEHPNLAGVVEVLDIAGRPAVLLDWLSGLFSADWPTQAASPGCWVRLATMAGQAIDTAHRNGLVHGRITSDSFLLKPDGVLVVTGFGEPPWLANQLPSVEPSPAADLRAFGQVLFGWSQYATRQKKVGKPKPFPEGCIAIIRRLECDAESPMADTVAAERPYQSSAELLADLENVSRTTPFSDDNWEKLLKHVAENAPDAPVMLKRSA